jgi:hypothetical protein
MNRQAFIDTGEGYWQTSGDSRGSKKLNGPERINVRTAGCLPSLWTGTCRLKLSETTNQPDSQFQETLIAAEMQHQFSFNRNKLWPSTYHLHWAACAHVTPSIAIVQRELHSRVRDRAEVTGVHGGWVVKLATSMWAVSQKEDQMLWWAARMCFLSKTRPGLHLQGADDQKWCMQRQRRLCWCSLYACRPCSANRIQTQTASRDRIQILESHIEQIYAMLKSVKSQLDC